MYLIFFFTHLVTVGSLSRSRAQMLASKVPHCPVTATECSSKSGTLRLQLLPPRCRGTIVITKVMMGMTMVMILRVLPGDASQACLNSDGNVTSLNLKALKLYTPTLRAPNREPQNPPLRSEGTRTCRRTELRTGSYPHLRTWA